MKITKVTFFLIFFLCIATLLRVFKLSEIPSGFHNDEASFYINAVSIKQTGKDEDGVKMPLFLRSFIDPKPALFSYLESISMSVFGENVFAARMVSVTLGLLSLVLIFLLLSSISDKNTALISVFLLSISPWHLMISRSTQEVVLSFMFAILSLVFLSMFLKKKQALFLVFFTLSALVSMYAYHSAKVFLPLTVVAYLFSFRSSFHIKKMQHILTVSALALSALFVLILPSGFTRFNAVSIFADGKPQLILDEQIRTATPYAPPFVLRMFHNKIVNYGFEILSKYSEHFTTSFFFIKGGEPQRYSVPFQGLFYVVELPLLLYGFAIMVKKRRPQDIFMFLWLFIAPLPAALTAQENPSMIRTFPMIVPLMYAISQSILEVFKLSKRYRVVVIAPTVALYGFCFLYFLNQLFIQEPNYHPWHRNVSDMNMATYVKEHLSEYKKVVISRYTGQPYVYLVMNKTISINTLQSSYPERIKSTYTLANVEFKDTDCPLRKEEGVLFVVKDGCTTPPGYILKGKASYKDGAEGYQFYIYDEKSDASLLTAEK